MAAGAGTATRGGGADGVTAMVAPSAAAPPETTAGAIGGRGRGGLTLFMPCGGVCGENGLGAASRGSSAPQPRQNL